MSTFLRIDINIAAMILLTTILVIANVNLEKRDKLNRTFLLTSLIILLELLFESMSCIVNKRPEEWLIPINIFVHTCLFITAPILTFFWYSFIHNWLTDGNEISQKRKFYLLIPVVVNFIISILSPFYGIAFSVNEANIYERGNLFLLSSAITYFYIIYSFVLILKNKNRIMRHDFIPLVIFGILPIIGGLLQTIFYGVLLMWSCSAFSLVIVYIFLQQRMIHLDKLTGAWTRESFDYYFMQRAKLKEDNRMGAIFLDLDGLKLINDKFGHLEGDYALKMTVELIKNEIRSTDIIARYGGDEFIIIMDCESKQILEKAIERIKKCFAQYNDVSEKSYKLECSFGADIISPDFKNIEQFLRHVDSLMYNDKFLKKLGVRPEAFPYWE